MEGMEELMVHTTATLDIPRSRAPLLEQFSQVSLMGWDPSLSWWRRRSAAHGWAFSRGPGRIPCCVLQRWCGRPRTEGMRSQEKVCRVGRRSTGKRKDQKRLDARSRSWWCAGLGDVQGFLQPHCQAARRDRELGWVKVHMPAHPAVPMTVSI